MSPARTSRVSLSKGLCAMDFSPASLKALRVAATLACFYGGGIFLPGIAPTKTISPSVPPTSEVASGQELMQVCVEQHRDTKLPLVHAVDVATSCRVFREEEDDTSA